MSERIGKQFPVSPRVGLGDEWGLLCETSVRKALKNIYLPGKVALRVCFQRAEAFHNAFISSHGRENSYLSLSQKFRLSLSVYSSLSPPKRSRAKKRFSLFQTSDESFNSKNKKNTRYTRLNENRVFLGAGGVARSTFSLIN